jgi:hypothetical protein
MMKLTAFALRVFSSTIGSPSATDGVAASSASVKYHWLASSDAILKGEVLLG